MDQLVRFNESCFSNGVFSELYKSMHLWVYGFRAFCITDVVWVDFLDVRSRLIQLVNKIARFRDRAHFSVIAGGFKALNIDPVFDIGPGNYRYVGPDILLQRGGIHPETTSINILFKFSRRLVL